jgi:hypothetical protein
MTSINYYAAIKYLYPTITDEQFQLKDDSEGQGVYITQWDYEQPKPTLEQLEAVSEKADIAFRLKAIRLLRNVKLRACDWTHVVDNPLSKEQQKQWAEYRQLLRDFIKTCDPFNPVWPVEPSSVTVV